jgi:hypothetical protein
MGALREELIRFGKSALLTATLGAKETNGNATSNALHGTVWFDAELVV